MLLLLHIRGTLRKQNKQTVGSASFPRIFPSFAKSGKDTASHDASNPLQGILHKHKAYNCSLYPRNSHLSNT